MTPVWSARNPNVAVEWQYADNVPQTVVTHAASGDLEDLLAQWMGTQAPQVWLTSGLTVPLDGYVKSQRINPRDWYKAIWDAAFVDGKQFSLPWQGQVFGIALYYNKNVFDEVGVKYPDLNWTLDDLVAAADKLKIVQGTEVKRWGMGSGEEAGTTSLIGERLPSHMRTFNAEMLSPDSEEVHLGRRAGVPAGPHLVHGHDAAPPRPALLAGELQDRPGQGRPDHRARHGVRGPPAGGPHRDRHPGLDGGHRPASPTTSGTPPAPATGCPSRPRGRPAAGGAG